MFIYVSTSYFWARSHGTTTNRVASLFIDWKFFSMFLHLTCVHICKYWLFLAIKFWVVCSMNVLVYMLFVSLQSCCFLFRYLTLFFVSIINKVIDVKDYVDGIALLEVDIYSAIKFKYSCLVNSCGMKNPIFFANLFSLSLRSQTHLVFVISCS